MKKIVLLINGNLGLRVLQYVINRGDMEITGVVINASKKRRATYLDEVNKVLEESNQIISVLSFERLENIDSKIEDIFVNSEYGVSALFGHVLPDEILEIVQGGIINLHPSLLPIGRGADPIPWSIIDQKQQGITIHIIEKGLDTGDILSQKAIDTNIGMNSGEIYELATNLLFDEFVNIFSSWIEKDIETSSQQGMLSTTHKSRELENIRIMNAHETATMGEFLRKLQALTFADGRKPVMRDESGRLWQIDISIIPSADKTD